MIDLYDLFYVEVMMSKLRCSFCCKWLSSWLHTSKDVRPVMQLVRNSHTNVSSETDQSLEVTSVLPKSTDVVVIGGGVIGCSTLYHLTKYGCRNSLLIERDDITSGTTWHTAGLLWQLRPSDVEIELLLHSRNLMINLNQESGLDTGWIQNGGVYIADNKVRLEEYYRLATIGKVYGVESHILSPKETKKLYPLMNVDDIFGSLYVPGNGTIEPAGYCSALNRVSTHLGARIAKKCKLLGVDVREDHFGTKKVFGIQTNMGNVACNAIVNCTGAWAPNVGRMSGVNVPQMTTKHAYVLTERIEGVKNMPNVRDHDSSIYIKLQGDALAVGGYEPDPIIIDEGVPDSFAFSLYELDWDVFSQLMLGAIKRIPAVGETGVKSTVCGPESFTPDHKPLMGEDPVVRGFYHGSGFNSAGMMLSGGCGKQLAHWIINGRPELDMFGYDIRRFSGHLTNNQRWIRERSHESYAKNYFIVFKHDEPLASRNQFQSPIHHLLSEAGCVFEERHGFERAGWFSHDGPAQVLPYDYYGKYDIPRHANSPYRDLLEKEYTFDLSPHHNQIGAECRRCREHVSIFDMSYFGKYYLTGPDAQRAVDWIFSNDMRKPPGSTIYTCMLNPSAGVEADLTVSVLAPGAGGEHDPKFEGDVGFYLAAGGGSAQHSLAYIQNVIDNMHFDVQLVDCSQKMALLSIQGPKSREVLQPLIDTDLSNESFPFSTHKVVNVAGESVRALRLSFVGELGWELHVPVEKCAKIYTEIMKHGSSHNIGNAGYRAIDSLSLEKGYRHWHEDLRSSDTPLEAGLAFTCKLKSDIPFLGRSALETQKRKGMKKRIAFFTIDDENLRQVSLHGLDAIWRNGSIAGFLRRAEYIYTVDRMMGNGYITNGGEKVNLDFIKSGTYQIESMGQLYPATVHVKSLFDPENKRVQGIYKH